MSIAIYGESLIPAFNSNSPSEKINLNDYQHMKPMRVLDGELVCLMSLELDSVDPVDMEQDDVADDRTLSDRIAEIEDSYQIKGWSTKNWCPSYTLGYREDGTPYPDKPLDGRGRILAAKNRGEKWIPVACYEMKDTSDIAASLDVSIELYDEATRAEVGTMSNDYRDKDQFTPNKMSHYVRVYIFKYSIGAIGKDEADIIAWFSRMEIYLI